MYQPRVMNRLAATICALALTFTDPNQTLDSRITMQRASDATYFDSSGTQQVAAPGVARAHAFQMHHPVTLQRLGFWQEDQRTNLVRNSQMIGASAPSTPPTNGWYIVTTAIGGVSGVIVGTGTERGMTYIDVDITMAAGSTAGTQLFYADTPAASASTAYTGTYWLRVVSVSSGSVPQVRYVWQDGITTANQSYFTLATAQLTECNHTYTTSAGATIARASIAIDTSPAGCTFRLRIAAPQIEAGLFATTSIRTTGATAVRLRDNPFMDGVNFSSWFSAGEGTFIMEVVRLASTNGQQGRAISCSNGSNAELIEVNQTGSCQLIAQIVDNSITQVNNISSYNPAAGTILKNSFAYKLNDSSQVTNGTVDVTDAACTMPTVDRMHIGNRWDGARPWNGGILSIRHIRARLDNPRQQALTT
jgi:hypothetical protein